MCLRNLFNNKLKTIINNNFRRLKKKPAMIPAS